MEEVNTVVLENGIEYMEVDKLVHDNNTYILLANYQNIKDSCIRKISIENNQEYLCKLNDDELKKVLNLFVEKNKALFN